MSGRKNDVLDCQWLQELESYGLLAGAFRPADEIVILRGYMRQRQMLVKTAAIHIQHMQKDKPHRSEISWAAGDRRTWRLFATAGMSN